MTEKVRTKIGNFNISYTNKQTLRQEIQAYKKELLDGGFPELPSDISLRVELADIEYDKNKYLNRSVYSDRDIKEALLDGHLVICPYNEQQLNPSSYNFTLGKYLWLASVRSGTIHNMFDLEHIIAHYRLREALPHKYWSNAHNGISFDYIDPDTLIFGLLPHDRGLAHTHEYIGIRGPGTSRMYARSTTGRNEIQVCRDAGLGDPGYINRWTVEIDNLRNQTVPIPVGYEIGQFVFEGTGEVSASYEEAGSYQKEASLIENINTWDPEDMLPKARPDQIHEIIDPQEQLRKLSEND